jgi:hypothetical protein
MHNHIRVTSLRGGVFLPKQSPAKLGIALPLAGLATLAPHASAGVTEIFNLHV